HVRVGDQVGAIAGHLDQRIPGVDLCEAIDAEVADGDEPRPLLLRKVADQVGAPVAVADDPDPYRRAWLLGALQVPEKTVWRWPFFDERSIGHIAGACARPPKFSAQPCSTSAFATLPAAGST